MFFGVEAMIMLLLPNVTNALLLQVLIFITVSMYGGGFALLPALLVIYLVRVNLVPSTDYS